MDANAVERHQQKVQRIVDAVKSRPKGKLISVLKNTPAHQTHNLDWKEQTHRVDVSDLNEIIGFTRVVDREGRKTAAAVCEGQVQMGQLSQAALERGLVQRVVPEYRDFTVAGLVNGNGIQTSCFKYGLFSYTLMEIEVVLADGKVVKCDWNRDADLYKNIVESYGSVAIVVGATVALRPAKPFVQSTYTHFKELPAFVNALTRKTKAQQGEFLEGLCFGRDSYVIVESDFVEDAGDLPVFHPGPTNYGERYYYQYIRQVVLRNGKVSRAQDVIPTYEFVHRSERGAYWAMEMHVQGLANFAPIRKKIDLIAEKHHAKHGFSKIDNLTTEELQRCTVMQDMGIKLSRLEEGVQWVNDRLGLFPLWLCPVHVPYIDRTHTIVTQVDADMHWAVDIGIYGEPTVQPFYHARVQRDLARFVDVPSTWGVCYESKETIRSRFDPIRERYGAIGVFVGIEDKVTYKRMSDTSADDELPISGWRLQRDHGRHWRIVLPLKCAGLLTAVAALVYACHWLVQYHAGQVVAIVAAAIMLCLAVCACGATRV